MDFETDRGISLNVFADRIVVLVFEVDVEVALEADTVNWATSLLEALEKIEHLVGLSFVPSGHGCVIVIVVEKLNFWVGITSSLESFADVVIDD